MRLGTAQELQADLILLEHSPSGNERESVPLCGGCGSSENEWCFV
jgi:hypothetical protein